MRQCSSLCALLGIGRGMDMDLLLLVSTLLSRSEIIRLQKSSAALISCRALAESDHEKGSYICLECPWREEREEGGKQEVRLECLWRGERGKGGKQEVRQKGRGRASRDGDSRNQDVKNK